MEHSACKDSDPSIFIMDQGYKADEAKSFCDRCSVTEECKAYARKTGSVGVWGGKVFSFRAEEPDYEPPVYIQDARPIKVSSWIVGGRRSPGILGEVANFNKQPGILG
jgi:hypothetical protein